MRGNTWAVHKPPNNMRGWIVLQLTPDGSRQPRPRRHPYQRFDDRLAIDSLGLCTQLGRLRMQRSAQMAHVWTEADGDRHHGSASHEGMRLREHLHKLISVAFSTKDVYTIVKGAGRKDLA